MWLHYFRSIRSILFLFVIWLNVVAFPSMAHTSPLPQIWNVPHSNPYFAGRKDTLLTIQSKLSASEAVAAIVGMGGLGKSQIALRFAEQYQDNYDLVWWFDASSSIEQQYAKFTAALCFMALKEDQSLSLGQVGESLEENIVRTNHILLTKRFDVLLIFDNVKDLNKILPVIPRLNISKRTHTLLTSRDPTLWRHNMVQITPFTREESIDYIQGRIPDLSRQDAGNLAAALADIPLALSQAVSYLQLRSGISIDDYIALMQSNRTTLWEAEQAVRNTTQEAGVDNHRLTLQSTIQLAVQEVRTQSPVAFHLLTLSAFLHNHEIPEDLYAAFLQTHGNNLPAQLPQALSLLVQKSLLQGSERGTNTVTHFTMHEVVQSVISEMLTLDEKKTVIKRGIAAFYDMIPTPLDHSIPMLSERVGLIAHINSILSHAATLKIIDQSVIGLHVRRLEFYLPGRRDFVKSADYLQQIEELIAAFPAIQHDIIFARVHIMKAAYARWKEGDNHKSIGFLEKIRHLVLDQKGRNEEQLMIYNGLAQSYFLLGDIQNAEIYAKKGEQVVANTPGFLGNKDAFYQIFVRVCLDRNQPAEAEPYIQKALQHLKIITNENSRAGTLPLEATHAELLVKQGRYQDAYALTQSLLQEARQFFKENPHSIVGRILVWQSSALLHLGHTQQARTSIEEAQSIEELSGDKPNRYSASLYFVLGEVYRAEGKHLEAQHAYKRAETIFDTIFEQKKIDEISLLYKRLALGAAFCKNDIESRRYTKLHRDHFGYSHPRTIEIQTELVRAGQSLAL